MLELRRQARRVFDTFQSVIPVNQLLGQSLPFSDSRGERLTVNDLMARDLPLKNIIGRELTVGDVMGKALPVLKRALRPQPGESMWIDRSDALELVTQKTNDPWLKEHGRNVIQHGVTHLPANVAPELCDRVVKQFHDFCDEHASSARPYRDENGYHSRLGALHMVSEAAMEIGMNERVLKILDFLFGYRTVVYTSLTFEKGSQQAIHQDAPFFRTEPEGFFFGVWTALEDVHPDSGPLTYYKGGHAIRSIDRKAVWDSVKGNPGDAFLAYGKRVVEECEKWGLSQQFAKMKKGDTLIWHPFLPHGGSPIADPARTRKSIVFHYLPQYVAVHPLDAFFDASQIKPKRAWPRVKRGGREFLASGNPAFDHNY